MIGSGRWLEEGWIKTLLMEGLMIGSGRRLEEGWIKKLLREWTLDPDVVDGRVGRDDDWIRT